MRRSLGRRLEERWRTLDQEILIETCLWRAETLEESPPNDEAMVLNSTCFISGVVDVFEGSLWTI